jgi:hypothetical protein
MHLEFSQLHAKTQHKSYIPDLVVEMFYAMWEYAEKNSL